MAYANKNDIENEVSSYSGKRKKKAKWPFFSDLQFCRYYSLVMYGSVVLFAAYNLNNILPGIHLQHNFPYFFIQNEIFNNASPRYSARMLN